MSLTNTEYLREEIDKYFNQYVDAVKRRTKCNLNDGAVNSEGFFRNFLNLLYGFNLSKDRIENPYNETIDLHNLENKICVQVTARNDKQKVDKTVNAFIKKEKYKTYKQLHFVIIEREKGFEYDANKLLQHGVEVYFHDCTTIFRRLKDEFDSYEKIRPVYNFIISELSNLQLDDKEVIPYVGTKEVVEEQRTQEQKNVKSELHLVDQILDSLSVFEGFTCIYPRTIARLPIFNNRETAYDSYSHYCLKTGNQDIHELLQKVKVENFVVTISDDSLKPFEEKIKKIFSILNRSLIQCICFREKYTEIAHHHINVKPIAAECDCLFCQFYEFRIKSLFSLLITRGSRIFK